LIVSLQFADSPVDLSYLVNLPEKASRVGAMFDEMKRLREAKGLLELLSHYSDLAAADRQVWQDRLLRM
jgi:hypothetical protein